MGQYDFHIIDSDTVNHAVALAYSIFGQGVPPFKIGMKKAPLWAQTIFYPGWRFTGTAL